MLHIRRGDAVESVTVESVRFHRGRPILALAGIDTMNAAETFAGGGLGGDLPVLEVPPEGIRLGAALTALGFTASNGEAKRKIGEGAVRLDDAAMSDPGQLVALAPGEEKKLSLGRKRHAVLRGS